MFIVSPFFFRHVGEGMSGLDQFCEWLTGYSSRSTYGVNAPILLKNSSVESEEKR